MSFRAWFYICKLAAGCIPLFVLGWLGHPYVPELAWVGGIALFVMIVIAVTGAVLGVGLCFGLQMRCPVCGQAGDITGNGNVMQLICEECGVVEGNVLTDFSFRVTPFEEDGQEEESAVI